MSCASSVAFDRVQGVCLFYKLCRHFEHVPHPAPASAREAAGTSAAKGGLDQTPGEFLAASLWAVCAVFVRLQLSKASVHNRFWKTIPGSTWNLYVHVYINISMYVLTSIYLYVYTHIHVYTQIYIFFHIFWIYLSVSVYIYVSACNARVCVYKNIHLTLCLFINDFLFE